MRLSSPRRPRDLESRSHHQWTVHFRRSCPFPSGTCLAGGTKRREHVGPLLPWDLSSFSPSAVTSSVVPPSSLTVTRREAILESLSCLIWRRNGSNCPRKVDRRLVPSRHPQGSRTRAWSRAATVSDATWKGSRVMTTARSGMAVWISPVTQVGGRARHTQLREVTRPPRSYLPAPASWQAPHLLRQGFQKPSDYPLRTRICRNATFPVWAWTPM